jgi:hypothetical protein
MVRRSARSFSGAQQERNLLVRRSGCEEYNFFPAG